MKLQEILCPKQDRTPKKWGWEETLHNSDGYCGKILHVRGDLGFQSSIHWHRKKTETFRVLTGDLLLTVWPTPVDPDTPGGDVSNLRGQAVVLLMRPGGMVTLPPLTPHSFRSAFRWATCTFAEFSSEDSPTDTIRAKESCHVPAETLNELSGGVDYILDGVETVKNYK